MARILVIDDDTLVRETVQRVLQRAGYEVETVTSGNAGLMRVKAARPDLVITDILMPEGEGIETIRSVRKLHMDLPILAISGGSGAMTAPYLLGTAEQLGATCTLAKPFGPADLLAKLRECFDAAGLVTC